MRFSAITLLLIVLTACTTADEGAAGESGATGSADRPTSEPAGTPSQIPCKNSIGDDTPGPHDDVVGDVVALPSLTHPALRAVQLDDADAQAAESDVVGPGWTWAKRGLVVRGSAHVKVSVPEELKNDMRIGWGLPAEPLTSVVLECTPADRWFAFAGGYWVREPGCYTVNVDIDTAATRQVDVGIGEPCPGQDPPTS